MTSQPDLFALPEMSNANEGFLGSIDEKMKRVFSRSDDNFLAHNDFLQLSKPDSEDGFLIPTDFLMASPLKTPKIGVAFFRQPAPPSS